MIDANGPTSRNEPPARFFDEPQLAVAQAIAVGDLSAIRQAAARGVDLNRAGREGMTLLLFAVDRRAYAALTLMVRLGANPEYAPDPHVGSAASEAVNVGDRDIKVMQALLDGGMSPNAAYLPDTPMLFRCTSQRRFALLKLLLDRGADINVRDSIGGTVSTQAVANLQPEIAMYLIQRGAPVDGYRTNGVSDAWLIQNIIDARKPGFPLRIKFEQLRALAIKHGAKFPPDPPAVVRAQMKARGEKVAE